MTLKDTHPYFIDAKAAGSHEETAVLLTGTADEFKISQDDIRSQRGGYRVTQALKDALDADYADGGYDDSPASEPQEGAASEPQEGPDAETLLAAERMEVPAGEESLASTTVSASTTEAPTKAPTKKTSGTRAARKTTKNDEN